MITTEDGGGPSFGSLGSTDSFPSFDNHQDPSGSSFSSFPAGATALFLFNDNDDQRLQETMVSDVHASDDVDSSSLFQWCSRSHAMPGLAVVMVSSSNMCKRLKVTWPQWFPSDGEDLDARCLPPSDDSGSSCSPRWCLLPMTPKAKATAFSGNGAKWGGSMLSLPPSNDTFFKLIG